MAEMGKVTPNQKCHRWSICVIYCPRCWGYRKRHSDNPILILYSSLHGAECQVMNMCHFVCRSLSGPGRASMENGVFRINDIENDREEIENSCLPEPCRLKCTSELSGVVPSSLSSSSFPQFLKNSFSFVLISVAFQLSTVEKNPSFVYQILKSM